MFKALKTTFPEEWENPKTYILSKTTGYTGIIKALPELYKKGQEQKDLSFDYFLKVFSKLKEIMQTEQLHLHFAIDK